MNHLIICIHSYVIYSVIFDTYSCAWNYNDISLFLCLRQHWNLYLLPFQIIFSIFSKRRQNIYLCLYCKRGTGACWYFLISLFIDNNLLLFFDGVLTYPAPGCLFDVANSFYFTVALALPSEQPVRCLSPGGAFIEVIKGDSLSSAQHVSRPDSGG